MNIKYYLPTLITLAAIILTIIACEREWENPWDEKANLDPNSWAPQNLQIEDISITEKKLTWTYSGDERIEGFKIDRKKGDEEWQVAHKTIDKETRDWIDTDIVPDPELTYSYRLYAYAGQYSSAQQSSSTLIQIPAPSNLQTEKLSDKSYKLTWTDNSNGEEGFKIDRKVNNKSWQIAYGTVNENHTNFIDTNVFYKSGLAINVEYRVYSFLQNYESVKVTTNTNAALTAPTYLQITQNSITSITLNWQDNSNGEEGFKIERKYEGGNWELLNTTTTNNYEDNNFELNTQVYYRVYAYVGEYNSSYAENNFDATIPAPTNLVITVNSITSVTLTWQDNSNGEDGFKIDRKINDEAWELEFATLNANQTTFTDESLDLENNVYTYRVYAFVNIYQSQKIEESITLEIGTIAFGGIVFYLDGTGGGLVCAETDQSTDAEWGCYGTSIGGTGTAVGTGAANTSAIVAGCSESGIAARICYELALNGYDDWFLPSKDELDLMYVNLKQAGIGGFADDYYWSSSEYSSGLAWLQDFDDGYQYGSGKNGSRRVRAVRAF